MKNFVQAGDSITVPAPAAVASGAGVIIGSLFGVAQAAAASGEDVVLLLEGVVTLPKEPSQAWAVGVRIYWDAAASRCTSTASGNKLIGACVKAVAGGAGDTIGTVRLNGAAVN